MVALWILNYKGKVVTLQGLGVEDGGKQNEMQEMGRRLPWSAASLLTPTQKETECNWEEGNALNRISNGKAQESLYLSKGRSDLFASSFSELLQIKVGLGPLRCCKNTVQWKFVFRWNNWRCYYLLFHVCFLVYPYLWIQSTLTELNS